MSEKIEPPETSAMDERLSCEDLDEMLRHYTEDLGYRIEEIFPADAPRLAILSRDGTRICLETTAAPSSDARPRPGPGPVVRQANAGHWRVGRAGMQYRDLCPDRWGGRMVASHIRIPTGGPVPDYVHYHHVRFQMIYCVKGWVRLVYEDQGPPFVMHAGDCVLQPPRIRHRVLECSDGLEVVELGSPAEHRTVADHDMSLPTSTIDRERMFDGQRFVFHQVTDANWRPGPTAGFQSLDTGIERATAGDGSAVVVRPSDTGRPLAFINDGGIRFNFVLQGSATLRSDARESWTLGQADSFVIPAGTQATLQSDDDSLEILQVALARTP